MKNLFITLLITVLTVFSIKAEGPPITLKTSQLVGSKITFRLTASANYTSVDVDWGNGTLVNFEVHSDGEAVIEGTLAGNTIKIYGTGISHIMAENMPFNTIDVSGNLDIKFISLSGCGLTSVNVINCLNLEALIVPNNNLTTINLTNDTSLTHINLKGSQVPSIDVSKLKKLEYLDVHSNKLDAIDVSANIKLTNLDCGNNLLHNLDISNNTVLSVLICNENQLTGIDVSKNKLLTEIHCYSNKITNIDVSNNTDLTILNCFGNSITDLDISKNLNISQLYISRNKISNLDVSNNTKLLYFSCGYNKLSALDLSANNSLQDVRCSNNNLTIASLPIKKTGWITYVYSPQNKITLSQQHYKTYESIDLKNQFARSGINSVYTWKTKGGDTLKLGIDYSESSGVFAFIKGQTDSVYCQIKNNTFPDLVLETSRFTVEVSVDAQFTANITSGIAPLTVNFTDQSTGLPTAWSWDFNNDGTIDATSQNPSHTYSTAGTYAVKLTASKAGSWDEETKTAYITVSSATGVVTTSGSASLKTYPNPSDGIVYIDFDEHLKNENIAIIVLDSNGKLVITLSSKNQKTSQLDLSGYASGIYYIKVIGNNQVYMSKVILK